MNDGRKKKGQKYQNKTEFKIQFNPLALQTHKKVSLRGLCKRCSDQLTWKQKYNKYKKMTEPAKCTFCHQKNVLRTYMRACQPCVQQRNICPKCLQPLTEQQIQTKLNQAQQKKKQQQEEHKMNEFVKTLKERSRRTVKRLFDKGTITWNNDMQTFVDEEGNSLALQFRQGYGTNVSNSGESAEDDGDQFGSDEDNSQKGQQKGSKQKQVKSGESKPKALKKEKPKQKEESEDSQQNDEDASQQQENQETTVHKQQKIEQLSKNKSKQILSQQGSEQQDNENEDSSPIPNQTTAIPQIKPSQEQGDWQDIQEDNQDIQQQPTHAHNGCGCHDHKQKKSHK